MPVFIPKSKPKPKSKSKPEVTMKSIPGQVTTEDEVREILKRADRNRDGRLSEEELKNALKELGSRWAAFRAFCCLQHADTNRDGQIAGAAEIDKLVAYILKWQADKL